MKDSRSLCQSLGDKNSKNILVGSTSRMSKKVMNILPCQIWEARLAMAREWSINILMHLNLRNPSGSYGGIVYNSCASSVTNVCYTRTAQLFFPIKGKSLSC